jgi:uncharacterized membrane protein required for colicin V production
MDHPDARVIDSEGQTGSDRSCADFSDCIKMSVPLNWFDLVVLGILLTGAVLGRKRGISEELLPLLQWLAIVVIAAIGYQPLGQFIASSVDITLMFAYIIAYLLCLAALCFAFKWIKRMVGEKLVTGDVFGSLEYYLGILAGTLRFACILLVVMSLVHAKLISPEQLSAEARVQRENFGSISFPTFGILQQAMFSQSVTGQFVKRHLDQQLIAATPAERKLVQRTGVGRRRERVIDEIVNSKP